MTAIFSIILSINTLRFFLLPGNHSSLISADTFRIIEKVYLHTDRNSYFAGDDIWFRSYLIDASDRSLTNHSNNLHVELISPGSKIIMSRVTRLEVGLGNGDFNLPDTIKTGRYRIRAYTNYMRNFSEQMFFNKEISVTNPSGNRDEIQGEIKDLKNNIELSFFPEGGSLVDNVQSVVAFKAVNALGKGCDVSGKICSSAGDSVTAFKSDHLGMGSFFLKPLPGLSYYSVVKDSVRGEIRSFLPKSFSTGVTLSASLPRDHELSVTIQTNPQTLPLIIGHDLLLTISARKMTLMKAGFKINSLINSFTLPSDSLHDGIVMMTLSTLENLPLSERLIYIQKNSDLRISIDPDKKVYNKRDSVAIRISAPDNADDIYLSLSAAQKNFTETTPYPSTISSWFLLESDIRGQVEEPSYYFDPSNPDRMHALDLLLMTQGWRDFAWKYNDQTYFQPENGFTVSGRVRKLSVDKPLEVSRVNIAIFGENDNIIVSSSLDSLGKFSFDGIDVTGEARLIVSPVNKNGNPKGLVLLDSIKYIPEKVTERLQGKTLFLSKKTYAVVREYELKKDISKKYRLSDTISVGEVIITAEKPKDFQAIKVENARVFYGKPNASIKVTQRYYGYNDVFDIIGGQVPGVKITGADGGYNVRIRGISSFNLSSRPLYLIDGVKKTQEDLISLPVSAIDRIDVLKSAGETGAFGAQGANGVISVITKSGDISSDDNSLAQSTDHSDRTTIYGYDESRIFYSPKHLHGSLSAEKPDFRTTLVWEPDIRINSSKKHVVKYFNTDNPSTIKVIVEGITDTGIPVSANAEYEVR